MSHPRSFATIVALTLAATAALARAEVKLASVFTDHVVLQREKPVAVWGTATPGKSVTIKLNDKTVTATADADGRFLARLPESPASDHPADLTAAEDGGNTVTLHDVLVGDVWICSGQSNMEFALSRAANADRVLPAATDDHLRLLHVPHAVAATPQRDMAISRNGSPAQWLPCSPDTVKNFTAVGYFFGKKLRETEKVPVGLIESSWGGTIVEAWTPLADTAGNEYDAQRKRDQAAIAAYPAAAEKYKSDLARYEELKKSDPATKAARPRMPEGDKAPNQLSVLYNGMIAPLVPMSIKGATWYQGESNAGRAEQYRVVFPAMISAWRREFDQGDFPFLLVQLAGWNSKMDKPDGSPWAELRDAQFLATQKLKNVGLATAIDVGNRDNIHPTDKQTVGDRLALVAEKIAYGKPVESSGPVFRSAKFDGNKAVLSFDHVGQGLTSKDDRPLKGFTVAGEDHQFHKADAVIDGDTVVLTAPAGVDKIVAARYAWADVPDTTLYNKDNLPALPFRTDDWPLTTAGNK